MDFNKLLKNHYVRLAILAIVAYLVYRYFFVVREGANPHEPLQVSRVAKHADSKAATHTHRPYPYSH